MPTRAPAILVLALAACGGDPGRPASPWNPGGSGEPGDTGGAASEGGGEASSDGGDPSSAEAPSTFPGDEGAGSSDGAAGSDVGGETSVGETTDADTTAAAGSTGESPASVWAGLEQDGSEIPRAGLANSTLEATLGLAVEPYGDVVVVDGEEWVQGSISWFGGPDDTGVGPAETGAITGEILRDLNDPLDPPADYLASHAEDYYYVAMRWSYSPNGKSFWQDARLAVRNPQTGATIVVRPVDWGPNTSTGRIIDLSPQSLVDLGLETDEDVHVAFALAGTPLGPVEP